MIVRIDRSFQKDLSSINDAKIKNAARGIVEELQLAERISSISNLKKFAGHNNRYRIRLGNYRIGLEYTEDHELI